MGVASWAAASADLTLVAGIPAPAQPCGMCHVRQFGISTADCDGLPRSWQVLGASVDTHGSLVLGAARSMTETDQAADATRDP